MGVDHLYTPWGIVKWNLNRLNGSLMCHQTTCRACKKKTWAGCGQHKNEVMRGVPKNDRCTCTQAEKDAAKGFFARLLGG